MIVAAMRGLLTVVVVVNVQRHEEAGACCAQDIEVGQTIRRVPVCAM